MHEQNFAILKALVAVAWADDHASDEELEVIEALLQSFGATPSEAHEIRTYARERRTLRDISLNDLSADDRRVLLQHAVLLTYIDGEQHEKEKRLLEQLCEHLRIPEVESVGIMAAADRRARQFLDLL